MGVLPAARLRGAGAARRVGGALRCAARRGSGGGRPVSRLVFAESDAEADEFYSAACTALAHGVGTCRALLHNGRPVCTVGCYEQSDTESYMAAGVTDPAWQGRGLARYLIVGLANELTAERAVRFACFPALCSFYAQLGFLQIGKIQHYTTDWNTT